MSVQNFKLIALDMDGTLLNEDKKISEENLKWINAAEKAGLTVILSTGRGKQSAGPYLEEFNLRAPMVLVNGSEIWKTPQELYKRELMPVEWIRSLKQLALDLDVWFWAYSVEGVFNRENWPDEAGTDSAGWLKFGYYTENTEKLPKIRAELESWNLLEITNSHPFNLELNPKGINKASGVREVCKLLGIGMSQVIAMGDSQNDISMIREAGLGIAMGNAQELVKQTADAVTSTNDEDGVARAIRRFVFGDETAGVKLGG